MPNCARKTRTAQCLTVIDILQNFMRRTKIFHFCFAHKAEKYKKKPELSSPFRFGIKVQAFFIS